MIAVRDLVHRYDAVAAVDGVSLDVADGEFLVVTGPNGSGKTTLVRHFNALLRPDEGSVTVNGRPADENLVATRTAVGMVFQHARDQLVASTVGADVAFGPENLGLPRDEIDRRVERALAVVNLDGRRDDLVHELSGGERKRAAIAGALAMEPDHVVLDEPFAGLDAPARASLVEHLRSLRDAGTSVVVVTHDLRDLLELADRVVALADGCLALDATPDAAVDRLPRLGVRVPACP